MLLTRPHPYMVSLLFVIMLQAISLISMQVGGQPFVVDMNALSSGDAVNAIRFAPENVAFKTTLMLMALELVSVLLRFGFQSFSLHVGRQEKASYFDLMDGFMVFFRAVGVWLIMGILVYLGLLLLIIPGFVIAYTYAMAPRLLLDHPDWNVFQILRESRHLMHGHRRDYFMLRLSLIGWTILRAFPFTAVFAEPYEALCETVFYLKLIGDPVLDPKQGPPSEDKPPWEY